jgi:hypothetical protein
MIFPSLNYLQILIACLVVVRSPRPVDAQKARAAEGSSVRRISSSIGFAVGGNLAASAWRSNVDVGAVVAAWADS